MFQTLAAAPAPPKTQQSNQPVKVSDVEHLVDTKSFSHWQQPNLPLKLSSPISL
jgi:hypothetical protein